MKTICQKFESNKRHKDFQSFALPLSYFGIEKEKKRIKVEKKWNEPFMRLISSTSKVERKRKYNTQSAYPNAVSAAAAVRTHKAIYCPF